MSTSTVDATQLKAGDTIVTRPGVTATVTSATEAGPYSTCTVHTSAGDILTTLPCPVQVLSV